MHYYITRFINRIVMWAMRLTTTLLSQVCCHECMTLTFSENIRPLYAVCVCAKVVVCVSSIFRQHSLKCHLYLLRLLITLTLERDLTRFSQVFFRLLAQDTAKECLCPVAMWMRKQAERGRVSLSYFHPSSTYSVEVAKS